MLSTLDNSQLKQESLNLRPKKFLMWLFVITTFMLFAAFTSGYIVYTNGSPARGIKMILPNLFIYSTAVIILSSAFLYQAQRAAKDLNTSKEKLWLMLTIVSGVLFCILQLQAWRSFVANGAYFVNPNASQSFLYIFTGGHMLHIVAGIMMLVHALWSVSKGVSDVKNKFNVELCSIFWHFMGLLWIYLYGFMLVNQ